LDTWDRIPKKEFQRNTSIRSRNALGEKYSIIADEDLISFKREGKIIHAIDDLNQSPEKVGSEEKY
jgi:hypothetical protein